jgi:hypothetical protein
MTCLGRHRREAELQFQSIRSRALEEVDVDGHHYTPTVLPPEGPCTR